MHEAYQRDDNEGADRSADIPQGWEVIDDEGSQGGDAVTADEAATAGAEQDIEDLPPEEFNDPADNEPASVRDQRELLWHTQDSNQVSPNVYDGYSGHQKELALNAIIDSQRNRGPEVTKGDIKATHNTVWVAEDTGPLVPEHVLKAQQAACETGFTMRDGALLAERAVVAGDPTEATNNVKALKTTLDELSGADIDPGDLKAVLTGMNEVSPGYREMAYSGLTSLVTSMQQAGVPAGEVMRTIAAQLGPDRSVDDVLYDATNHGYDAIRPQGT